MNRRIVIQKYYKNTFDAYIKSVFVFLLYVVLSKSFVEQLVTDLSNVIFDDGYVAFGSGRVNIFVQELTVVVRQAVLFADTTIVIGIAPFGLNFVGGCGIINSLIIQNK